ncbi:Uma2 family endonuclease [Phenylobacterium sp.]|uniref:Uma2 family endonuclease n=1 Tax=Phenylobacterium sp. TaxID=1871053 RepID=UPI0025CC7A54|nr:Uma2 family endonuclease [Phenylobacterium sp.]MBX3483951.1 Uma2 family endonuclease [Phenylobacterium sp.]
MNAPLITRAAEGYDRRAFTVAEVHAMVRAGIMDPDEPVELWEGEFVPMNAKHNRHELWKRRLTRKIVEGTPATIAVSIEPSVYLSDITFLEPDIVLYSETLLPEDVRGPDCLLVIEVSDSSLSKDLRGKARLYARYGVAHYWVLDAEGRRAWLMSEPVDDAYQAVQEVAGDGVVTLPFDPTLTIRLQDLG